MEHSNEFMQESTEVAVQQELETQPASAQQPTKSPVPEPEDTDIKHKIAILIAVIAVLFVAYMFIVPALNKGTKGATSVITDSKEGYYHEFFTR